MRPGTADVIGPTVLLADDFEDARDLYRHYLELRGYRVIAAADGAEAIALARASRPAVVLLDIRMPGVSGIDVMHELKRDPAFAAVPMVALTAHALPSEREAFLASGFDAVLAKPCLPEQLVETVGGLLPAPPQVEAKAS